MVREQVEPRGIGNPAVLAAMATVPRHCFVPEKLARHAYDDAPLPIGEGQTISQPYMVAAMCDCAELGPLDRVLEVGAGSGYGAAVLASVARQVVTVERHAVLAETAQAVLVGLGFANVTVVVGDGSLGEPGRAPYDAIVVTAAGPDVPAALTGQLADGGRLVMPVEGSDGVQHLLLVRRSSTRVSREELGPVRFVPLVGEQGWHPDL